MRARRRRSQRLRSSKRVTCLRKSTRLLRCSATAVSGGGPNSARAGAADVANESVSAGRGSKSFLIPGRLNFVFNRPLSRTGRRFVGRRDEVLRGRRRNDLGLLRHDILLSASRENAAAT